MYIKGNWTNSGSASRSFEYIKNLGLITFSRLVYDRLNESACPKPCIFQRFSREAILWGQLSHPNLLPFFGLYRFRSRMCIVSPWMENGPIPSYLENTPRVDRVLLVGSPTNHSFNLLITLFRRQTLPQVFPIFIKQHHSRGSERGGHHFPQPS